MNEKSMKRSSIIIFIFRLLIFNAARRETEQCELIQLSVE